MKGEEGCVARGGLWLTQVPLCPVTLSLLGASGSAAPSVAAFPELHRVAMSWAQEIVMKHLLGHDTGTWVVG